MHLIRTHYDDANGAMRSSIPEAFTLGRLD